MIPTMRLLAPAPIYIYAESPHTHTNFYTFWLMTPSLVEFSFCADGKGQKPRVILHSSPSFYTPDANENNREINVLFLFILANLHRYVSIRVPWKTNEPKETRHGGVPSCRHSL